ncbi:hypothetical protein AGR2A_pc0097 [Agrobacterium genomosp. 2 str. CFBP 5494]|uniref:Uncharacterized protein n=1 Tax=Agrobacterium genomosp. 2 str. CFBP 5494 TaxID=1183436 RepID=A0A9W5F3Q5_9HYPH|nr:hypothetical protein AGR2A_pc0097 [Agrobacterium genomosp. 2 str. CFBP 5494]
MSETNEITYALKLKNTLDLSRFINVLALPELKKFGFIVFLGKSAHVTFVTVS